MSDGVFSGPGRMLLVSAALLLGVCREVGADGSADLRVRLEKEVLAVGGAKQLAVEIDVPAGRPEMPGLFISAGSASCCEKVSAGKWRGSLTLPDVRYPMPIIVAAKVPGLPPAWAVLKTHSRTRLAIKTDKPRVTVTLRVGERSYGPVLTDAEGSGMVEVDVWPGELEGSAFGVDEFGNRSTQKVPIALPPVPLLLAIPEQLQLAADGVSETHIWVVQVDAGGRSSESAEFSVRINTGKVKQTVRRAAGLFRLDLQAPQGKELEQLLCEFADRRQPRLDPIKVSLQLGVGRPRRIATSVQPPELPADGASEVWIQLKILDAADNPVAGVPVRVNCSAGQIVRLTEEQPGIKDGAYLAPTGVEGEVSCQAVTEGVEKVEASFSVRLIKPVVGGLFAEAEETTIVADGRSQVTIRLRAEAKNGRSLEGASISASAPAGTLSRVVDDGGGKYHAIYTAPALGAVEKVRLEFSTGAGEDRQQAWLNLRLEPVAAPDPPAPHGSLSLWAGVSSNFGSLTLPALGLEAALRLPFGRNMLCLAVEGEYRFLRDTRSAEGAGAPALVEMDAAHAGLLLVFRPFPGKRLTPFLQAGGGAAFFEARVLPEGGYPQHQYGISYLILAGAGAELHFGATALFLQVRYSRALLPSGTIGEYGLRGNSGGIEGGAGLRLFF